MAKRKSKTKNELRTVAAVAIGLGALMAIQAAQAIAASITLDGVLACVCIVAAGIAFEMAVFRFVLWHDRPRGTGRVFYEHRKRNRHRIKRYGAAPDDPLDDLWPLNA